MKTTTQILTLFYVVTFPVGSVSLINVGKVELTFDMGAKIDGTTQGF